MKRKIKWQRWDNPVHEDEDGDKSLVRVTPFGIDSIRLNASAKNALRFYVGNTNFDIDDEVRATIKDVEGVEIFNLFSPYRFRVCVGAAFNAKSVLRKITSALCLVYKAPFMTDEIFVSIMQQRVSLEYKGDPWIIYVLPNGKFETYATANRSEYEAEVRNYTAARASIGGTLILS